nr:MAG TPA: hypothetical protein [Caudoviricetes sp.]
MQTSLIVDTRLMVTGSLLQKEELIQLILGNRLNLIRIS